MKKIISLTVTILLLMQFTACGRNDAVITSTTAPTWSPPPTATPPEYNTGLTYASTNTKTTYNGYTYELARIEQETDRRKTYTSILYRYTDAADKTELYHIEGNLVYGIFIGDALYYFSDGFLKKLNLNTITTEHVYTNTYADYMFQYDNYIFFPSRNQVIRYDLLSQQELSVITSARLDGYEKLTSDNVFVCNDELWIVVNDSHIGGSFYKANLDGSQLTHAGFTVSDYNDVKSVSEKFSWLTYNTQDGDIKKISLIDGTPVEE